jgi:hypothetical protein
MEGLAAPAARSVKTRAVQGDLVDTADPGRAASAGLVGPAITADRVDPSGDRVPPTRRRGIDQGRNDHQPFTYEKRWVQPTYNQDFNSWGFWFLGIWIPREGLTPIRPECPLSSPR